MPVPRALTKPDGTIVYSPRFVERQLEDNPLLWGYFFFPDYFRRSMPIFHFQIMQIINTHDKIAIASPRGSAKSTLLAWLYPFHQIMFKNQKYIVLVGNTEEKATEHLTAIKNEIKNNKILANFMSIPSFEKDTVTETIFAFHGGFKAKVLCKGVNQVPAIRGTRFGPYRPTMIIGDDMEDDEMVRSRARREQLKEELDDVLKYAGDDGTKFVFIGTILHDNSQIAKMLDPDQYTDYCKIFLQALNKNKTKSLWEAKWTVEELKEMEKRDPRSFAKEMQNDPVSGMNVRFKREDFRYWRINNDVYELLDYDNSIISRGYLHECKGAMAGDLAWSMKRDADYSVILAALLTPNNDILVESFINEQGMRPDRLAEIVFMMNKRLVGMTQGVVPLGLEKAMLENVSRYLLKQQMRKRGEPIIIKELKWDSDKIHRIETRLQPRYANHMLYHRHGQGELENQLERFPYGTYDDIIDALQGVVQLLKNPKQKKKAVIDDTAFEWWRKKAIKYHRPSKKTPYIFGNKKSKKATIPSVVTFR